MIGGMSVAAKTEQDPESCIETPLWLVERIRFALGGVIDLDPCTTPENPVGALRFYAPPEDGISLPWDGERIFVNPPYGRTIRHWAGKSVLTTFESLRQVILLVPARTDSEWFQSLATRASGIVFFKGRIQFKGQPSGAKFPSALVGLNHDLAELSDLGWRVTNGGRHDRVALEAME